MSQPSIATRVVLVEHDLARHELELVDHDGRLNTVERRVDVIAARIGIYATLGAVVGGALASVIASHL